MSLRKFNKNGRLEKTISTLLHRKHTRCEAGVCLLGFPLRSLDCAVSFCQPTMSSSSRAAIRHLVDSRLPNLPPERSKGQEGSAEAQPVDHDTNYGRPYHHILARFSCHLLLSIQHVQHQPGSTPGLLSIAVEPKSYPGKRAERQEGSAGS